uniref:receptor-type tyrosine-protein phosphatase F-like n=1 Tax=Epinephelus lanceolatus TaxID=310571 RepID=UPI0014481527|nr:receptor-type tyrosine-protein phosphatase F-like [Epinephelus lanceolatus]
MAADAVPGAPPRKVEADALNSTAIRVTWKPPLSVKQHGQIRGYQLVYSRLENWEPHGQPVIMDVSLPQAQEAIVTGLLPETTYSVTVAAYTTKGDGAPSKAKVVTTTGAVPGKPTMMISTTVGNTALIQWQPPKEMVGEHVGYQLQYKRAEEEAFTIKDFRKADDHFTVTGLHKGATYIFKLCTKNQAGNGEEYVKEISTPEDIPSSYPQNLTVVGLTATSNKLAWDPPPLAERNGKIVKYVVVYRDINSQHNNTDSTTETQMTVQGLQPDTTYDIRVQAFTSKGGGPISPSIQSRTMSTSMPDLPSAFTKDFSVKAVMKTSVLLTWEVPETYKSQVPLKILYNQHSVEVPGNLKRKLITQLQPDTDYSFILMSRGNSAGGLQQQVSIRTAPDLLKMKPARFQHHVEEVGKVTISLPRIPAAVSVRWYYIVVVPLTLGSLRRWENPEDMDIHELLEAGADSSLQRKKRQNQDFLQPYIAAKLDTLSEIFTLGDEKKYNGYYNKALLDQQQYHCFVLAEWTGHESQRTFAASPFSEPIMVKLHNGMTQQTEDPEMLWVMGPVLAVILIIIIVIAILLFKSKQERKQTSPAKDEHMAGIKDPLLAHSSDPVEMRRLNYQTQGMDTHTWQQCQLQPARGSGQMMPEPRGHPPGAPDPQRRLHVAPQGAGSEAALTEADAGDGSTDSKAQEDGGGGGVLFLEAGEHVKGGQPMGCRWWRAMKKFSSMFAAAGNNPLTGGGFKHRSDLRPGSLVNPGVSSLDNINGSSKVDILSSNSEIICDLWRQSSHPGEESIDPGQQFTWEHSNLEVNKSKNRYANVIAYDHSRVILTPVDGVPGSDYINANYIDGYRKQNAYIATQGPLLETLSDFWRMVWEQRTSTIIMMTRLEERSRVKCDQYWPSRGTETYGMIQVTMLDTLELATYSIRTFALYKSGSSEKREVRQFQFMAWPDHGVPEYPTPTLAFLCRVKACNPPEAGPMVVHCSAGVGRTGCFIVIKAMLERMKHEKSVDIYGYVTCMRAQRNYMVQTEDQYIFIHEALLEAATCGNTEVPARNLYTHIQKLSQIPPGETVTTMELEFKKLANSKPHTSRFICANLPCNKFKNRLVNIMPFESTRICLQPIRGVEGSDYINASFIDGYRQQKAYMATQGPLAETTEDFWRMLWEHNSTIVVMLTNLHEMGQEKCHQYWPAERSARYQYFVVDPMAEYNMPQYILREFKVTDARDGQSRTIRQFQFTDWPEQGVPKTLEGFIDFIGQVHKTKEQFGQDGPITVHCSAGVGRTGVFITLSIILERMRYEGVVDLFQTVKTLRTQRSAMVQTEEQYQLCYRAALEYLGSFDHYAT